MTGFPERIGRALSREVLIFPLETNYRSRPEIVALASDVIERNEVRLRKAMRAVHSGPVEEGHVNRIAGQLRYVAPSVGVKIRAMVDAGLDPSDIAVLYRKEGVRSPQMSTVRDQLNSLGVQIAADAEDDGVRLLTIHRAKGQEFEHVFVLYLRAGDFPDFRGPIEEERRLLYVALTRARSTVYICGVSDGSPDLFAETDVASSMPTTTVVDTLTGVLEEAALEELRQAVDDTDINDWDEAI
jgi:superfamily I DNA/RNA helicase